MLGDNIFHGHGISKLLQKEVRDLNGCTLFGYQVSDPERYGVAEVDDTGKLLSIEEKPRRPKSNLAVTGLYMYDNEVIDIATKLKPSARGELEITDVNNHYVRRGKARLVTFSRGMAWLDTGTHDSLMEAAQFVQVLEHRTGIQIACLEEIAFRMGYIDQRQLQKLGEKLGRSSYGEYLRALAKNPAA